MPILTVLSPHKLLSLLIRLQLPKPTCLFVVFQSFQCHQTVLCFVWYPSQIPLTDSQTYLSFSVFCVKSISDVIIDPSNRFPSLPVVIHAAIIDPMIFHNYCYFLLYPQLCQHICICIILLHNFCNPQGRLAKMQSFTDKLSHYISSHKSLLAALTS